MSLATFPSEIPFDSMMKVVADIKAKDWTAAIQEAAWSVGCTTRYIAQQPVIFGDAEDVAVPSTIEGCCALIEGIADKGDGFGATVPKWLLPTLLQIVQLILQQIAQG